jgi:hypothetical protein
MIAILLLALFPPVGYHPSNVTYFNTPYFANALFAGCEWRSFSGTEFGDLIDTNTAQFINGYPQFLAPGQKLRATLEIEHIVTIPATASFAAVSAPFELRIVPHGAEFDGHRTSLTRFKFTASAAIPARRRSAR